MNSSDIFLILFQMVVSKIRLPLMDMNQLFEVVQPCLILDLNQLIDAIQEQTTSKNIRYRRALCMCNEIFKPQI